MIKSLVSITLLAVGAVVLAIVVRIVGPEEILKSFSQFSFWGIIPLLVFTFANHIMSAIKWQYILRVLGVRVSFFPLFKIWLTGYAVSYITPVAYIGGEFFRAYILKDRYNVSWHRSLSSISIDKIVEASAWVIIIFAGIVLYLYQAGLSSFSRTLTVGIASSLFFMVWLVVIYIFSFRKKSLLNPLVIKPFNLENSKSGKFLTRFENEFFDFFSFKNYKNMLVAFQLAVLKSALLWLRNLFLIYYLAHTFSYSRSLIALSSSYISYSLPIPAALGAHEAVMSFVFSGIGLTAGIGAVFTFLARGAEIIMVTAGLVYLLRWGVGFFTFKLMGKFKSEIFTGGENGSV